jgi:hypothetical protein
MNTPIARTALTPIRRIGTGSAFPQPRTGLQMNPPRGPNSGGTITRDGNTTNYAPSAYAPSPTRSPTMNSGGTITRGDQTSTYAPTPYTAPVTSARNLGASGMAIVPPNPMSTPPMAVLPPAPGPRYGTTGGVIPTFDSDVQPPEPSAPPQTEANNPLTGSTPTASTPLPGASETINPGTALGFNQRGSTVPSGQDAMPTTHVGGTGLYARKFNNPKSADVYNGYVRRLFGNGSMP